MRILLTCLAMLAAPLSRAETITFRSGEHPTFSRLVLSIPPGAEWRLGRVGADYALALDPQHDFDTDGAFERIPRDRLTGLVPIPGTGRLILETACDCHATAFLFAPDRLVIDIVDGAAEAGSVFEATLDPEPVSARVSTPEIADLRLGLNLLPDPLADIAAAEPRVSAVQAAIVDSIARAATQGLLEVDLSATGLAPAPADNGVVPVVPPSPFLPPTDDASSPSNSARPGISVQTSVDRDRPVEMHQPSTISGGTCLDDSQFDLSAWGDESGFSAQIGSRLSALTTERDLIPDGAVEALARSYLFFGFGAEAEQALSLDGKRTPEREILRNIGRIIDGRPTDSSVLSDQIGCARAVALWAALARGTLAGTDQTERIAIQTAHQVLPLTLRALIGTQLAQLFLEADDAATAQAIIAASDGARDTEPSAPSLTDAEIAIAVDDTQEALMTLETLAADENRLTPDALIALIDLSLAEQRVIDDDTLAISASLRFENRGTDAEVALGLAELRALMAADRFADAAVLLKTELHALPDDLRRAQITDLITAAADRMPDAAFLEFAFGPLPGPIPTAAENRLADRLLALGFAEAASALVEAPGDSDAMAERRRLRARADMALGRTAEGEAELTGMTDAETMGILEAANAPFEPGPQASADTLWRSGEWDRLERSDDPLLAAASAAMMAGPEVPDPDRTLGERRALLDDAAATRNLAADLLARFVIDPTGETPTTN